MEHVKNYVLWRFMKRLEYFLSVWGKKREGEEGGVDIRV